MGEVWKAISGLEHYSVSNLGNVRNDSNGHLFSPTVRSATSDYLAIVLPYGNGKYLTKNVHTLVAETFCEKKADDLVVNHIDGDKHNNRANNLEWVTRSENDKHAFRMGLRRSTSEQIQKAIDATKRRVVNLTLGTEHESIADAGRAIGGRGSGISKVLSGERPTYLGMRFAYSERG